MMKAQDRQKQLSPAEEIVDAGQHTLNAKNSGADTGSARRSSGSGVRCASEPPTVIANYKALAALRQPNVVTPLGSAALASAREFCAALTAARTAQALRWPSAASF